MNLILLNKFTKNIKTKLSKNKLVSGFIITLSGSIAGQIIGIASTPLITRLYSPSDFGILVAYSAIVSIIISVASLRYETAMPLSKEDIVGGNLLVLSICLIFITTFFTGILLVAYRNILAKMLNAPVLGSYIWLIILGIFGASINQLLIHWAVRKRDYAVIAKTKFVQSIGGSSAKIILGILSFGPIGLLIGDIISQSSGSGTLGLLVWKMDRDIIRKVSIGGIISSAKEYYRFPLYSGPAAIFNTAGFQLPALALSYSYGSHITGLYALAYSIMILPTSLISLSLFQAYFGEVANLIRERPADLESLYLSTTRKLIIFVVPFVGSIALIAPLVFPILFGSKWTEAGIYCMPLALVVIPNIIVSPLTHLDSYGLNQWDLIRNMIQILLIISSFFISHLLGLSAFWTLTAYGLIMAVSYFVVFLLNLKAIRKFNKNLNYEAKFA